MVQAGEEIGGSRSGRGGSMLKREAVGGGGLGAGEGEASSAVCPMWVWSELTDIVS
jgi:hypothetical protein